MNDQVDNDFTKQISKVLFQNFKSSQQSQTLDPERLELFKQQHIKPLYPHKIQSDTIRKYFCCQACCEETPGYFCCCSTTKPNKSFMKFGLSICLYFKFLKHSFIFLAIISILSILSGALCYQVAKKGGIDPMQDYSNFFFSLTYGAFSAQKIQCQYFLLKQKPLVSLNKSYETNFNLKCPSGKINLINPVLSNQNKNSIYNCRNQIKKITNGHQASSLSSYILSSTNKTQQNTSCKNMIDNNCQITIELSQNVSQLNYTTLSYAYSCGSNQYFITPYHATKHQHIFYGVVAIDFLIILFFLIFFVSENQAQNKEKINFKITQATLSDYTLRITGFHRQTAYEELDRLFAKLKGLSAITDDEALSKAIVGCTFPESSENLQHFQNKFKLYNKIRVLFEKHFFWQKDNKKLQFEECYKKVLQRENQQFKQFKQQLKRLTIQYIQSTIDKIEMQVESDQKVSLFLTFNNIKTKKKIIDSIPSGCCSSKIIALDNQQLHIQKAPVPDMIQWQNRKKFTKIRVCISWTLTIAICFGSYLLIGYIQYEQLKAFSNQNYGIDCNVLFNSTQLQIIDNLLLNSNNNYVTCVCKNQKLLDLAGSKNEYCSKWNRQYLLNVFVPLLISFAIVVYNVIVMRIFKILSKLQYHKFLIDEEISYTFKRAFILISNMGVIIILLNFNYFDTGIKNISILFTNRYDDFTPDWYIHIGSIIILTMIFNIMTPIGQIIISWLLKVSKKCWDRTKKCSKVPTSAQTKSQYIQLYDDDIFPISERYAYLIALFMITFSFSGVIPILLPIAALSLFLLYFSDKILIFKLYQSPLNYSESIHSTLKTVIFISVISHLALTSYFLSEPFLIQTSISISSLIQSNNSRISDIFKTSYIIPYVALLFLILLYIVIKKFFVSVFKKMSSCLDKFASFKLIAQDRQNIPLFTILSSNQTKDLLKLNKYLLQNYQLLMNNEVYKTKMLKKQMPQKQNQQANKILKRIILNNIDALQKKRFNQSNESNLQMKTSLIGLSSYEYLMNKNKLRQNQIMMEVEHQLRQLLQRFNKKNKDIIKIDHSRGLPPSLIINSHLFQTDHRDQSSVNMNKDQA